ncbi:uncharacterized protein Z518_06836 [Rhinocladiella mackenziei CBS 650.93]|uniref:AAA+ ATPase domain-containing protein n=1 Tax=Rhinocladiella mackenziei CBS 650.93 TaxID=1442369 RepID=A0A0D2IBU3_9EURO|nr:uncharacterized protein Z518_06836 [Rhinocladiella mackenziei CBS 650.93]KIX03284.1 hypothetical protein Z518_06836 [Rhinocladiella mackenziei CBS 650.93]
MSARSARLSKYFHHVEQGKKKVEKTSDAKLFLEALCEQPNRVHCIERLFSSANALESLQKSMRFDLSVEFLNGPAADTLMYLKDPDVEQLCNGQILQRIIQSIVQPPTFWNTLVETHNGKRLDEKSEISFAWLLLHLLSRPSCPDEIVHVARTTVKDRSLLDSTSFEVRSLGYKIQNVLETKSTTLPHLDDYRPGGRHDNDFEDFHKICILPTPDEIASTETPFYRRANEVYAAEPQHRPAMHFDNQFRLLREDFLAELRNDLQIAQGQKKGRRSADLISGLAFMGIDCGTETRRKPCSLTFRCERGLPAISNIPKPERKRFLADNRNILKHQSFGCLLAGKEVVAFASIDRNEDLLAEDVPVLALQMAESDSVTRILSRAKKTEPFYFVVVDTAVFAYEHILRRLQEKTDFPLSDCLLASTPSLQCLDIGCGLSRIVKEIEATKGQNLQRVLGTSKKISLDNSQFESLITGLTHSLSLIQGPPGTGKSFIGALLAKVLHDHTNETILVICYTNHALDQFLEDLMDIGIPTESMVRLGSKSSDRTRKLGLAEQSVGTNPVRFSWNFVNVRKEELKDLEQKLKSKLAEFSADVNKRQLLEYLEFSEDADFCEAFTVPEEDDGMQRIGKGGRRVHPYYLLDRWTTGRNAGIFQSIVKKEHSHVWDTPLRARQENLQRWRDNIWREYLEAIAPLFDDFNRIQSEIEEYFYQTKNSEILQKKRIIGCTTTAAAKYAQALQAAKPGVILVEEAGEILESHVLTAMTADTRQLILIGDHKQLRPKVNNYSLTVEKGEGFDLNRSLFERLVLTGYPHTTLSEQHRMRPEISQLIRHLTYPDLLDAGKTKNRPHLRGFQDNIIFVNHEKPELDLNGVSERRDPTTKGSKQNPFEVEMVLKCVRYIGQQGYGTDKIVVLTPYLGQLHLLRKELSKTNDPMLNDLDSHDLVRAGLVTPASAKLTKRPILISTIDNYQGEEREIVIATLTRSNKAGDVGFMAAPERLNVLLSRARNALILIGNSTTFLGSKKAKTAWQPLFDLLTKNGHVYDGFPVKCERHQDRKTIIRAPESFDVECPDGGCSDPCSAMLRCDVHVCPQRCHQVFDHSKMDCTSIVEKLCAKKHRYSWRCHRGPPKICPKCEREQQIENEKKRRDFELELRRQERQNQHARQLAELQQKIEEERGILKDIADEKERQSTLAQKVKDLETLRSKTERARQSRAEPPTTWSRDAHSPADGSTPGDAAKQALGRAILCESSQIPLEASAAQDEWERQKKLEGQSNEALDSLMGMIGLEEVKDMFLSIKTKVDVTVRQNTNLRDERFSAALLGNPGTGKTTVARLYAKFLSSVGVIPGDFFVETSGSRLANDGIAGCRKHLEEICNSGGGALFIDEAYQLVSGQNYGGKQVLDFLLAEVENLTGKIVFILAGYNKNMEDFFAHNPGIPSRFPVKFQFGDYSDVELQTILRHRIEQKYNGRMEIDGGIDGLYIRIVSCRIGRGRGRDGFGNARSVRNEFSRIADRQARRLQQERRLGRQPDDMFLTKEDLIGPEPASVLKGNTAWEKLQNLTGLESVKQTVQSLFDTIQSNYQRELEEKKLVEYSLNKVFVGNPGTGKTTVAKLYGQILADIGLLSSGEVVVKNPSDFVGNVLGASESTTRGILASTIGKVLVIDEAYMLYGGSSSTGGPSISDPYKMAVIDTIVAEVQSVPGDDRCVLLLGYKEQMESMFQNVNPGLSRRFPMDSAFVFDDYTDDDLQKILNLKLNQIGFNATPEAKGVARECLRRARDRPHFGNAGEVDILLDKAKMEHQKRLSSRQTKIIDTLEPLDFDANYNRAEQAPTNCRKLFEDVVGCDEIIHQLEGYQRTASNMRKLNMDPREQIPFSFLFRGPPGTGKTSTARRMGKIFYDMGFLANAEVIECSATDLVGQYVGQTGPKTQGLLEKALGKVLFIDEAYRLAEGQFAKEAMDELVDTMTKPKFAQKLIIILAGYDENINRLISINPGLTSRFPETVCFKNLSAEQCLELFQNCLQKSNKIDSTAVQTPSTTFKATLLELFGRLAKSPAWGNARDVKTLAKSVLNKVLSGTVDNVAFEITEDIVLSTIQAMVSDREDRKKSAAMSRQPKLPTQLLPRRNVPLPPVLSTATNIAPRAEEASPPPPAPLSQSLEQAKSGRDPDVSDDVWNQLQSDQHSAEENEKKHYQLLGEEEDAKRELNSKVDAELETKQRVEEESNAEARRLLEEELHKREKERLAYLEKVARMVQERQRREEERKKEKEAQKKLREMGVCVAGFRWVKQAGGYRCAGGSHFVSDAQIGL